MSKYNVSIVVPISIEVEANDFRDAIDKAFYNLDEAVNYGGDGIYVVNQDTGETYEE